MDLLSLFDRHKRLLDSATSDDETPTPGYVYLEICKLTQESNEQCTKILEHLMRRLKKVSPAVKLKTLLVLRHVIQKGNSFFRRELQRRTEDIRECLYFKGPPDPLRGDAPYQLVREQAQIVVNMLFDTEPTSELNKTRSTHLSMKSISNDSSTSPSISNTFSRPSGTGSEQYNNPLASKYTETYRGPTGIGNVYYKPQGPSFFETIKRGLGLTQETPKYSSVYYTSNPGKLGPWSQPTIPEYSGPIDTTRPMGGWGDSSSTRTPTLHSPSPSVSVSHNLTPQHSESHTHRSSSSNMNNPATLDLQPDRERRMVDEITLPSGVRAVPTAPELLAFCKQCQNQESQLNLEFVFSLLLEKLSSPRWQARLKALHVIEALLQSNVDGAFIFFKNNITILHDQTSSTQKSISDKAKQILTLLEPNNDGVVDNSSAPPLKTSDTESPSKLTTTSPTINPKSQETLISIFDMDLTIHDVQLQKDNEQISSIFEGLTTSDSSNSANSSSLSQTSSSDNSPLFTGLNVNNNTNQLQMPITISTKPTTTTATTPTTTTITPVVTPTPPPTTPPTTTTTAPSTVSSTEEVSNVPTTKSVFAEQLANIEFDPLKATSISLVTQQQQQQQIQRQATFQPVIVPVAGVPTQAVILTPYPMTTTPQSTVYVSQPMRRRYMEKTQETQSFTFLEGQEEDTFDSLVKQEIQALNKVPSTSSATTPCSSK